eukprot:CAMPEP_0115344874 /NCGR_PEP_ID=MMETSP0270-20121206/93520_1 /TAXON_ID=71861 /ORGANISM="Scrippsiella trochoidea, Strain CCMP3099" /LENGTH=103 /DNA_ID=CAMNT_0002766639 /DNA_START=257 /DNA_END=565 /DNA_ORIENTATION=-
MPLLHVRPGCSPVRPLILRVRVLRSALPITHPPTRTRRLPFQEASGALEARRHFCVRSEHKSLMVNDFGSQRFPRGVGLKEKCRARPAALAGSDRERTDSGWK